jgi:hypothetical protein
MIYDSYYEQPNSATTIRCTPTARTTATKASKQLPEQAIALMNAWYIAHEDNPYPNRNDLDYLATNGGIKESQVKAWFSNKRNRTQNTHPKRAKRYLVRHQAESWDEPQKIHVTDTLEQRAIMMQHPVYSNIPLPSIPSNNWLWSSGNAYHYCHQ